MNKNHGYTFEQPSNRFERRFHKKIHPEGIGEQFNQAHNRMHSAETNRRIVFSDKKYKGEVSRVIFEAPPVVSEFMDALRQFHFSAEALEKTGLTKAKVADLHYEDAYGRKIRELSLFEIENLPIPLELNSIRRLYKYFRNNFFTPSKLGKLGLQLVTETYAVENILHPHLASKYPNLRPLKDRINAFFDYYADFLLSAPYSNTQSDLFLSNLFWTGGEFIRTVACYTSVRAGLSASSTQRLFDEKSEISGHRMLWDIIKTHVKDTTKFIHRPGVLPAGFTEAISYNLGLDNQIINFFLTTRDQLTNPLTPNSLDTLSQIIKNRRFLRTEILKHPDQSLRFESSSPLVRNFELAVYPDKSTAYKNTLLVKLNLASGDPLLIEANDQSRVFGLPGILVHELPSLADQLIHTIIRPPIMGLINSSKPVQIDTKSSNPSLKIPLSTPIIDQKDEPVQPKVKTRPNFLSGIITQPEVPLKVETQKPKKLLVEYDLARLVRLAGKKVSREEISRFQQALYRLEIGEKEVEALTDLDDHFKLRVGDWRIILRRSNPNTFIPIDISTRDQTYRGHQIRRFRQKIIH